MNKKFIAIILALLVTAGAVTYIAQQETPVEPTVAPIETPAESPAESPVEEDTAVEGQLNADGAEGEGKLDGSAGENIYDMTNYMESLTDSNSGTKVDQEYAFDLEEQKQETPVEGTVGSDTGSDVGGSVDSGNGGGNGTGTGNGGTQQPTGNGGTQQTTGNSGNGSGNGFDAQTNEDFKNNGKTQLENDASIKEVGEYNEEVGGWEVTGNTGREQVALPGGAFIDKELLDILKQYNK